MSKTQPFLFCQSLVAFAMLIHFEISLKHHFGTLLLSIIPRFSITKLIHKAASGFLMEGGWGGGGGV
jgi:hypothetical protein